MYSKFPSQSLCIFGELNVQKCSLWHLHINSLPSEKILLSSNVLSAQKSAVKYFHISYPFSVSIYQCSEYTEICMYCRVPSHSLCVLGYTNECTILFSYKFLLTCSALSAQKSTVIFHNHFLFLSISVLKYTDIYI